MADIIRHDIIKNYKLSQVMVSLNNTFTAHDITKNVTKHLKRRHHSGGSSGLVGGRET